MVLFFLGTEQAGYYANYLSLFQLYTLIIIPVLGFIFPIATELIHKNDTVRLRALQNNLYTLFSIVTIVFSGLILSIGPQIAYTLFGVKFAFSGILFAFVAPFLLLSTLTLIHFPLLSAYGEVKLTTKIIATAVVATVIANLALIPLYQTYGTVLATILGWLVMNVGAIRFLYKKEPIAPEYKKIVYNIIYSIIASAILFYIKDWLFVAKDAKRFVNLGMLIAVSITYIGIFAILNRMYLQRLYREFRGGETI